MKVKRSLVYDRYREVFEPLMRAPPDLPTNQDLAPSLRALAQQTPLSIR
jgi:hypothetical protein